MDWDDIYFKYCSIQIALGTLGIALVVVTFVYYGLSTYGFIKPLLSKEPVTLIAAISLWMGTLFLPGFASIGDTHVKTIQMRMEARLLRNATYFIRENRRLAETLSLTAIQLSKFFVIFTLIILPLLSGGVGFYTRYLDAKGMPSWMLFRYYSFLLNVLLAVVAFKNFFAQDRESWLMAVLLLLSVVSVAIIWSFPSLDPFKAVTYIITSHNVLVFGVGQAKK